MNNVVKLRADQDERSVAIRGSINARAAHLGVPDDLRRKWVGKALGMMKVGASAGLAISVCNREMTSEHLAANPRVPE
jgi:DNA mismatch repair protein MutH